MWKLMIRDDDGRTAVVPLKEGEYILGRQSGSRVRLNERNVSREHARLYKASGDAKHPFVLEDLKSHNGTLVNGYRIAAPKGIAHGDLIQIGDYRIVLQNAAAGVVAIPTALPDDTADTFDASGD